MIVAPTELLLTYKNVAKVATNTESGSKSSKLLTVVTGYGAIDALILTRSLLNTPVKSSQKTSAIGE